MLHKDGGDREYGLSANSYQFGQSAKTKGWKETPKFHKMNACLWVRIYKLVLLKSHQSAADLSLMAAACTKSQPFCTNYALIIYSVHYCHIQRQNLLIV